MRLRCFIRGVGPAVLAVTLLLCCSPSPEPEHPNIVLIVSDALRPDHLGCYGYHLPTSPTIDSLAQNGILFENAVAQAPWTKASFSSVFTALYPFQHGVLTWGSPMADTLVTLAEILADNGYETACVMNMIGLAGRFRVLQGFNQVSAAGKLERDAGVSTTDAIGLLKEGGEPFFLVLHYFDTHRPYTPGAEYYRAVHGRGPEGIPSEALTGIAKLPDPPAELLRLDVALFDAAIRYVDNCVGRVLSYLEDAGTRRRTFVVFTADHGDALWEHGLGGHAKTVYDEELRVPLIVAGPEESWEPRRVSNQVGLIDLHPTILELAGIEDHPNAEGMSLIPLIEGGTLPDAGSRLFPSDYAFAECTAKRRPDVKCIRRRDWKIIVEPSTARYELYNLVEDPGETRNLFGMNLAVEDTLLELLDRVPGTSLGGWRLAFIGNRGGEGFTVEIEVAEDARIVKIERLTQGKHLTFRKARGSRSVTIEAAPIEMEMLCFSVSPDDAPLTVRFSASGDAPLGEILAGPRGRHKSGATFRLRRRDAFGLPEDFQAHRELRAPGAHIWWLPGEQVAAASDDDGLTTPERERLRALGYIQ